MEIKITTDKLEFIVHTNCNKFPESLQSIISRLDYVHCKPHHLETLLSNDKEISLASVDYRELPF